MTTIMWFIMLHNDPPVIKTLESKSFEEYFVGLLGERAHRETERTREAGSNFFGKGRTLSPNF